MLLLGLFLADGTSGLLKCLREAANEKIYKNKFSFYGIADDEYKVLQIYLPNSRFIFLYIDILTPERSPIPFQEIIFILVTAPFAKLRNIFSTASGSSHLKKDCGLEQIRLNISRIFAVNTQLILTTFFFYYFFFNLAFENA